MRLLVLLAGMPCDQKACAVAAALAKRMGVPVEGLYVRLDAGEILPRLGEGLTGAAIDTILESNKRLGDEASARARSALSSAAQSAGLAIAAAPPDRPAPAVFFQDIEGPSLEVLDSESRLADVVVFGEPGEGAPIDWMTWIERAMLALRRPVIVARGAVAANFGEKIIAAYDGSLEAANAITRAAPILAGAKEVEVVQIREAADTPDHAAAAVRYLRQHGANASAHELRLSHAPIGEEIGARANAVWASLIVMGGYGHSRLREFALGGATRHLINHAPVPVLFAH